MTAYIDCSLMGIISVTHLVMPQPCHYHSKKLMWIVCLTVNYYFLLDWQNLITVKLFYMYLICNELYTNILNVFMCICLAWYITKINCKNKTMLFCFTICIDQVTTEWRIWHKAMLKEPKLWRIAKMFMNLVCTVCTEDTCEFSTLLEPFSTIFILQNGGFHPCKHKCLLGSCIEKRKAE